MEPGALQWGKRCCLWHDSLTGVIPDQGNGYGTSLVSYPSNGIQNGSPDGMALVHAGSVVIQFLSYEALSPPSVGLPTG